MKLEEKKIRVQALHEKFLKTKIAILTEYKGLNVASINSLRKKLRENNIEFKVIKNTFLSRASDNTDIAPMKEYFKGASAIAFSYDDPVIPAKILTKFAGENDKLKIKVGVLQGKLYDFTALKKLSNLPSREILISQILSVMNEVPTRFVRTLSSIPTNFLNVLQSIKEKKEKE